MTDGIVETVDLTAELGRSDFYNRAQSENLAPLWRVLHGLVTQYPKHAAIPAMWSYDKVRPYLMEACELISTEESERRVLVLENPGMKGESRITQSLFCGLQVILPGEIAPPHRHVASALRFILEGTDTYTAIEGERTTMHPGDFVITPSWTWHEHGNESSAPMIWIDGLDMHIVNLFGASFRENYAERNYPLTRAEGSTFAEAGSNMLPMEYERSSLTSPILNYPYIVARDSLDRMQRNRDPDRCHGFKMSYINPINGGSAMPTMSTSIQLLPKGFRSEPYRSTAGAVFVVVEGEGTAFIEDQAFPFGPKDVLVVPSWCTLVFDLKYDTTIFSYSDRIVQEKLDIFREKRGYCA